MSETCCSLGKFLRLAEKRQAAGELSVARQVAEMAVLYPFYGVGPGFYQLAGFWKRDVSWHEKIGYLREKQYNRRCDELNPPLYQKFSQHKLAEKSLFRLLGIPSAEHLGYLAPERGVTADGQPLETADDLRGLLLRRPDLHKICFKMLEGWGGRGFHALEIERRGNGFTFRHPVSREDVDIDVFVGELARSHRAGSVIESYIEQHPQMAAFNPTSLNTMRIWARRYDDGHVNVLGAFLRMGRAGSLIDNRSAGGIVVVVDLDTGRLDKGFDATPDYNIYAVHPDHGARIEGAEVPMLGACKDLVKDVLRVFPKLHFAGLDVAVAPDGPRIVEINVVPDRSGACYFRCPTKYALA